MTYKGSHLPALVSTAHDGRHARWRSLLVATALVLAGGAPVVVSSGAAYAAGPTISSFSPVSGPVGTAVTITGTGFTGATAALFGAVPSTFSVTNDTTISATVPFGASRNTISVHTPSGNVASKHKFFKVTPSVTGFTPGGGPPGTPVTISGSAFKGATAVTFAGIAASSFTVNSYSSITATVPAGTGMGPVAVTTQWGTGVSSQNFNSQQHFDVTNFGAHGDGTGDNAAAFNAAIAAAQNAGSGSIVDVPAGTYTFSTGSPASIQVGGTVPIVLAGAGRATTKLVELTIRKDLLSIHCDHTIVQDLTFDTQTNNGGHGIGDGANNTTVQRVAVYSGTLTFGIYYPGPKGAHPGNNIHSEGNVVDDVILNDQLQGDGFSFSFQDSASVSNIVHTGSHITIYADTNTTFTNYNYTPGNFGGTSGWVISSPCVNVTITNFTSSGFGGQIRESGSMARVNQNITINNEQMTGTAPPGAKPNSLFIGDVQGLLIENSSLQEITIEPRFIAQGTVTNTTYTKVRHLPKSGATDAINFS